MLACDIVVATAEAKFGLLSETRVCGRNHHAVVGVSDRPWGSRPICCWMALNDRRHRKAASSGLFHEIVGQEHQLYRGAQELAGYCAACAPDKALLLTKRMLNETVGEHLTTQLTAGAAVSATARTTDAAAEGLAAFLEKREPKWL